MSASPWRKGWAVLKSTASDFIADECLGRGAAIAYYTVFSLAPVLIIAIALAGLVLGNDAARGALLQEIGALIGAQGAETVRGMIAGTSRIQSGWAGALGIVTLLITATGVFTEMQAALNAIWRARPAAGMVSQLVRARLVSLGLVMALGFLLLVSLLVSTALAALGDWLQGLFPAAHLIMRAVSFLISLALISALFAAIYKVLPDTSLAWRDVAVGAVATALLFDLGKLLIGLYIGSTSVATSFGAAGAFALVLLWIYYSAQIFLLGAEFTRAYADIVHNRDPRRALAVATPAAAPAAPHHRAAPAGPARAPQPPPATEPPPGAAPHPAEELDRLKSELRDNRVARR